MTDDQETPLEEFSIEAPAPPEFLSYESGGVAVSYDNEDTPKDEGEDGTGIRHGRGPRFWLLIVGALVLVIAAVGGGVGAAMAGRSSDDHNSASAVVDDSATPSSTTTGTASSNSGSSFSTSGNINSMDDMKEDKQDFEVGGVVNLGTTSTPAPTTEVYDIILTHSRYHGLEFEDINSYQSKAVAWVESTADLSLHTAARLVQRYALACLYYATNSVENFHTIEIFGEGNVRPWIDETDWLSGDECTWYKITCNDEGYVTRIELDSNRLTGALPPELTLLKNTLEVLDFYQNLFHNIGDAGNHWLGELTNLKELFYARTYMEYDGIPTVIGLLTNLQEYDCSYTLYNGPLVGQTWATLSNLEYLHIGGNRYNSSVPVELALMPKLEYLYAEYTDLTGDLSFISLMPEIVELWVDRNPMMGGSIPSEVGLVDSLRSFSVTDCGLTGTLPTELGELQLKQFWCYNNSLVGDIPSELGQIQELSRLGLENNEFRGSVPSEICDLRSGENLEGNLDKLEADCDGEVECSCCTCCGEACFGSAASPSGRLLEAAFYSY
ncbi:leucine rich repeat [Seminavis robusta]|uniref:Leucine rich repeat n=1 Tax=Seminavis robusta TaxID=568900 RepID=A0A9N8E2J3_9STRA|nr:leucine rich repeat [Seminavis robusta]|eukprot:Sro585_g171010.1 leucine rich repeat (553) ;mRNA; f:25706-27364